MKSVAKNKMVCKFQSFSTVYEKTFKFIDLSSDVFRLKIYVGEFALEASATNRIFQEVFE